METVSVSSCSVAMPCSGITVNVSPSTLSTMQRIQLKSVWAARSNGRFSLGITRNSDEGMPVEKTAEMNRQSARTS